MCKCNKCNSHDIIQTSEQEVSTYKDSDYSVDIEYSICNSCEREFLSKPQIIANEAKVREAKKKIDGLLSSEELKKVRKHLGLSQIDASVIFGGGRNAFSKYERSEVTQSNAMDKLLRLASSDGYIFKKLLDLSELDMDFQFVASVDISEFPSDKAEAWANNQFTIASETHEISKPKLRLVA